MNVEYTYTFDLPRDLVWQYIQDEQVLRNSLPGCKSFEEGADGVYHAELGLSVGPIKGLFVSEVKQVNQKPPVSYSLLIKSRGTPGEIEATADMFIEEIEGTSKITCSAEVHGTGVIASLGQRVMGGVAKVILGQFFKSAEKEMKKFTTQS